MAKNGQRKFFKEVSFRIFLQFLNSKKLVKNCISGGSRNDSSNYLVSRGIRRINALLHCSFLHCYLDGNLQLFGMTNKNIMNNIFSKFLAFNPRSAPNSIRCRWIDVLSQFHYVSIVSSGGDLLSVNHYSREYHWHR